MTENVNFSFSPVNNTRLANLCGVMDDNLNHIARAFSVKIKRRGEQFQLQGDAAATAATVIQSLYLQAEKGIGLGEVRQYLAKQMIGDNIGEDAVSYDTDDIAVIGDDSGGLGGRAGGNAGGSVAPLRNTAQKAYWEKIINHSVVLCAGPAGTGKTHVAVVAALELLRRRRQSGCRRLVLTRPVVEAGGERLGFLPGDMEQKINPYLRPLYDILDQQLGRQEAERRLSRGEIEIIPLAFMRGLTLNHTVVILDEAQNTTPAQMKMFLTRMGEGAKMIITGDVTQNDLPPRTACGLSDAIKRLKGIGEIARHQFAAGDIVRHPLVAKVLRAYEKG